MPRESLYGILSESPYQGITDRSWTKFQEYPALFRQVLERIEWGKSLSTQAGPYEEMAAVRLKWYTFVKFVRRHKDIHFHFQQKMDHIEAKLIKLPADQGVIQFGLKPPVQTAADLGLQRLQVGGLTEHDPVSRSAYSLAPPLTQNPHPWGGQPVEAPLLGNPGMQPPGFSSPQHFTDSLNPDSQYNKDLAEMEARMEAIDAEGRKWREEMDAAIELQDSRIPYSGWKRRYPDEAEYHRLIQLDTSERRERKRLEGIDAMVSTHGYGKTPASATNALSRLTSLTQEDLDRIKKEGS